MLLLLLLLIWKFVSTAVGTNTRYFGLTSVYCMLNIGLL